MKKIRFLLFILGLRVCDLTGGRLCGIVHPYTIKGDFPESWWERWF